MNLKDMDSMNRLNVPGYVNCNYESEEMASENGEHKVFSKWMCENDALIKSKMNELREYCEEVRD